MNTRQNVLRAAGTLFAQRGFEGASTRQIAELAGANQALIRYHFGGKDPLWREVVDAGLDQIAEHLNAAAPATTDRPAALIAALAAHAETLQSIVHALLDPGPRRDWLMRERLGPLRARALAWLGADATPESAAADPTFLLMWIAAAAAPAAFAPALAAVDRALDPEAVQRRQREALEPWLRGEPLIARAGPWSLAEARRRRSAAARP